MASCFNDYIKEGLYAAYMYVDTMFDLVIQSREKISQPIYLIMILFVTGVYHFDLELQEALEPPAAAA